MWQINETFIRDTYKFTDEMINDIFQWALSNIKVNKTSLIESITNPKLSSLATRCKKLRDILYRLSHCNQVDCIYEDYKYYIENYDQILSGIKPGVLLCQDALEVAKEAFQYFYEELIETDVFWDKYSKESKIKKIQVRAKIGEKYNICPYCNVNRISYAEASNMDHFLPISKYPVLGVHGDNLVVACLPCNLSIKNDQDGKFPIIHPYKGQVADYFKFTFDRKKELIGIDYIATDPIKLKQTENYLSLFKIEKIYKTFWRSIVAEEEIINKNIDKMINGVLIANIRDLEDKIEDEIINYIKYLSKYKHTHGLTKLKIDFSKYQLSEKSSLAKFFYLEDKRRMLRLKDVQPTKKLS